MRTELTGNELAKAQREGERGHCQGDNAWVQEAVFLQEFIDPLVGAHEQDVLAMHKDVQSATQATQQADQGENKELLRVEGKVHCEVGGEHSGHGVRFLEPHGEQPEDGGSADGGKEASPVVADRKVRGGYFDAEEDTCGGGGGTN